MECLPLAHEASELVYCDSAVVCSDGLVAHHPEGLYEDLTDHVVVLHHQHVALRRVDGWRREHVVSKRRLHAEHLDLVDVARHLLRSFPLPLRDIVLEMLVPEDQVIAALLSVELLEALHVEEGLCA